MCICRKICEELSEGLNRENTFLLPLTLSDYALPHRLQNVPRLSIKIYRLFDPSDQINYPEDDDDVPITSLAKSLLDHPGLDVDTDHCGFRLPWGFWRAIHPLRLLGVKEQANLSVRFSKGGRPDYDGPLRGPQVRVCEAVQFVQDAIHIISAEKKTFHKPLDTPSCFRIPLEIPI